MATVMPHQSGASVQQIMEDSKLLAKAAGDARDPSELWRLNIRGPDSFATHPDGSRPDWFWTGPKPVPGAPGIQPDGTITSLPLPDLSSCTRQQALDYFDNTWLITEIVFSGLQGQEAYYRPPYHNLRHPKIFYYAHPAALYVNKLRVAGLLEEPVNAYFEHIFETGVDEMSWDDLSKNDMMWPSVREVTEYRREVYQLVRRVIEQCPCFDRLPITWDSPAWALFMGFEHERIHIETSSVLIRELPLSLVRKPQWWPKYHPELATTPAPDNAFVTVPAADVTVGKPLDWPSFGWDNEYGDRRLHCREFDAMRYPVTNAQFLEFVKAGGYRDESLWTADGWQWRTFRNAKWPPFWVLAGPAGLHHYNLRVIFEVIEMPAAAPVVVNAHEARAFCQWLSRRESPTSAPRAQYRLTTEIEHKRLRDPPPQPYHTLRGAARAAADPVMSRSGVELRESANTNLAWGAEAPVTADAASAAGVGGAMGNVWHWCEDLFAALPNSHGVHVYYDDFSTPCYDGQHNIIQGGSFMSTGDESSVFARFHFRPHFHQHAGFRVVRSSGPPTTTEVDSPPPHVGGWNPTSRDDGTHIDPDAHLALKMLTHYASAALSEPLQGILAAPALQFPLQARDLLAEAAAAVGAPAAGDGSLLEVGCSVGGVTFRLAENYRRVVAIDLDAAMIRAAAHMQANGQSEVRFKEEGVVYGKTVVARPVPSDVATRIEFRHMDPCCIAPDIGAFDAVVLNDVLDRCASPKGLLGRMAGVKGIVSPGGLLMIIAAYDWDVRVLDPKLWLGGQADGPSSRQALAELLGAEFDFVMERELQYVTREHARKFSLVLANAMVWRRRSSAE